MYLERDENCRIHWSPGVYRAHCFPELLSAEKLQMFLYKEGERNCRVSSREAGGIDFWEILWSLIEVVVVLVDKDM